MQRKCSKCSEPHNRNSGMCPPCFNTYQRDRRLRAQAEMRLYKIEKGCSDCGYNQHHAGLEFDHIAGKAANVSLLASQGSVKAMWREIAKCEVVCGTCHNIRTYKRLESRPSG